MIYFLYFILWVSTKIIYTTDLKTDRFVPSVLLFDFKTDNQNKKSRNILLWFNGNINNSVYLWSHRPLLRELIPFLKDPNITHHLIFGTVLLGY